MEYLENQAKVNLDHVAYKGAAPAMQDLLGSQVDAMFPSLPTGLPHIKSGMLRALVVVRCVQASVTWHRPRPKPGCTTWPPSHRH